MKEIPLTQGKVALVDDADYEWLTQWDWLATPCHSRSNSAGFYAARNIATPRGPRRIFMHNVIMGRTPGFLVDHKNRDPLDNQRENLRLASNAQNRMNAGLNINNTSGFKGVCWSRGAWLVQLRSGGRTQHLGYFAQKEDAAKAYDAAAKKQYGEFAYLNFPEQTTNKN